MTSPKIAIFYDWLNQWGGAEKVLLDLLEAFPGSDLFTLVYDPKKTSWLVKTTKVQPSLLQHLPFSNENPIFYTPLYSLALEAFDFSDYDILISTTSTIGHCLLTQPQTMHVCYYHNINRYLYHTPSKYKFLTPLLKTYRLLDKIYSARPDYLICNSKTVQKRIKKHFKRDALIINPGIDTEFFKPSKTPADSSYFLVVSRLVPHKRVDLVIDTFKKRPENLIVVGKGRLLKRFQKETVNSSNITILPNTSDKKLLKLYQNCTALICPQEEDFGITPLEAMACGKPVIAFNRGGITETVLNQKTGIFFNEQSPESLANTLDSFKNFRFDANTCRDQSLKFSRTRFMINFKKHLQALWKVYKETNITIS